MLGYSTVTQKGQITLPADIRRVLGLKPAQRVMIIRDADEARIKPAGDFLAMGGAFASSKPFNIRKMRESAKRKLAESYDKKAA